MHFMSTMAEFRLDFECYLEVYIFLRILHPFLYKFSGCNFLIFLYTSQKVLNLPFRLVFYAVYANFRM